MRFAPFLRLIASVVLLVCLAAPRSASALEHVTFRRDGKTFQVAGRVEVTAEDGGLLVLGRDGMLWRVEPQQLVKRSKDEEPFTPLSAAELSKRLLADLPKGFAVYPTAHYLVCYNTSRGYAQWCGSLLERLYLAFTNSWSRKGFALSEPAWPLVAIVFADRQSYAKYAQPEIGEAAQSIVAYYNLESNRITMYDLTGSEAAGQPTERSVAALINRLLSQPEAEWNVATIVHEATHQIAFNCGLHTRLSDCPRWFSEGIALYFETPDVTSIKGWRNIGAVNKIRLARFLEYVPRRPSDSLVTLLAGEKRFHDPKQALDAYAESWALTFYLIQKHPKQYVAYLRLLAEKKPLLADDPATRLAEFKQAFGEDLRRLDAEFVRYMSRGVR